jgi:cytosine/adenosine deaminase-related metal-dependent hydrolase
MIAHVSKWVLPVSEPPIREGAVVVAHNRIQAVGPAAEVLAGFEGLICDHGSGAILPGLVNCHVHLEFSALAGLVPPQGRWEDWLAATLGAYGSLTPGEVEAGVARGLAEVRRGGAALVGEVTNTGLSLPQLKASPLSYHLFYEVLGFDWPGEAELAETFAFLGDPEAADSPLVSAAAHAPYSVSAPLFQAVSAWNRERSRPQMVHLAESQAEMNFLTRGNKFLQDLLKQRGRWVEAYEPPGRGPAAYLHGLDFLGDRTLAVHGARLDLKEIALLARTGTWLVLCPRANRFTGAGAPPVARLLRAGVPLALGSDSLAGNWDLNLFAEMRWLHRLFPSYPGDLWLRLATLNGARALGRARDFGTLEPGKLAALGFVALNGGPDFWEELFVAGSQGRFRWLH